MDMRIVYLTLYNLFGLAGWGFILFTVLTMAGEGRLKRLWDEHEWTVKVVQGAAVLEIAHAGLGLVRSPMSRTFIQVSRAASRAYCCAVAAAPRRSSPVRRPHRTISRQSRGRVQVFSRVAIVWGAQDPLYKYPFTPFPKPKGCELTLETGPECTEERNHQVMLASGLRKRAVDLRSSAQPHTDGLLLALAGYRRDTRDVEHC
jgi:hypothetical protein